ncbi:MAG: lipolytic enzyme family [Phycisphaerales bacterium]|nr:lipolytic enzyme family [Phycisphaerales bacterium]
MSATQHRLIARPFVAILVGIGSAGTAARAAAAEPATPPLRFAFGAGPTPPGYARVTPTAVYSADAGFGFEPGAKVTAADHGGAAAAGPARAGSCSGDGPFFFSAAVPSEGNYRVTVTLGGPAAASVTTVKAELRRLMLEQVRTAPGAVVTRSFIVNVRTPALPGGGRVKLKVPRETTDEAWAWDGRVTLEFNGSHPSVAAVEIEPAADVPTVYLLGDSTVCDQSREPYASWGQMLPRFLKPDVAVANHAESGDTLASAAGARRLEKVLSLLKPGEFVLVQYGHNDMKAKAPDASAAYKAALKRWVGQIKERGGVPVLVMPMNRHSFDGTTVTNSLRDYREAAREEGVALVDLNAMSKTLYEALGPTESARLFAHPDAADPTKFDGTHHSPYGAYELARCVAEGLRRDVPALARHLADDLPAFDPAKPDPFASFAVPPSPGFTARRPLGD